MKGKRAFAHISKSATACMYCGAETRAGSLNLDGIYAHKKCFNQDNAS